jgi:hypothetical protein
VAEPAFRRVDEDRGPLVDARDDVVHGLSEWFTPEHDDPSESWQMRADLEEGGELTNGRIHAVAWRFRGLPRPEVWGVASDRGAVDIDGVTFVDTGADDGRRFSRYVDWHGAFAQLGVAAAGHIVAENRDTGG